MEVVFSLHAAWVWNNDLLSLSLFFCVFAVLWCTSTLVLGLCTPVCTPSWSLYPPPFFPVPSQCGVSGWFLRRCRLICKYTHLWPNTPSRTPSPTSQLPPPFSSASDSACCVQSCAAQSCLHKGEWAQSLQKQSTACEIAGLSIIFLVKQFQPFLGQTLLWVLITPLSWLLCGRMLALMCVSVWLRVWTREGMCIQVDNSCFCSLYRLVFQDSVLSPRLPQVGSTEHQTHSVNYFTVLPPLILWIIFWSELESVLIYFIYCV